MKYVIIKATPLLKKDGKTSIALPIIFPDILVHDHVARCLSLLMSLMYPTYKVAVCAAGFVSSADVGRMINCSGESTSIGVQSRGQRDTDLIRMSDYGSCFTDD
jgi:hypothetical protein